MPRRSSSVVLTLLAGIGLGTVTAGAMPAGAAAARAHASARTHAATCDELRGTTFQRNDRWRIFGTEADTFNSYLSACRRTGRPVTRVLRLGAAARVPALSGDLLHVEGEARYDNCSGAFIDLAALRSTLAHDCSTPGRDDVLLPSGAIAELADTTDVTVGNQRRRVGTLTIRDGNGSTPVATGAWNVVPFAATATSPEGFYFTASDGSLQLRTTNGRADTSGWTSFAEPRSGQYVERGWVAKRARVKTVPGRTTTYVGLYELRRVRAAKGRKASLTVRHPNAETTGSGRDRSDLIARLAPGSAADFRLLGFTFVGRFADDPSAVRLWVPSFSKPGRSLLSLPFPTDPAAAPVPAGEALAFPTPTGADLLVGRYYEVAPSRVSVTLPPGAHSLAATTIPGQSTDSPLRRLLYTDASGRPGSLEFRLPGD